MTLRRSLRVGPDSMPSAERPWYEVAFGELYPVLYAHRDARSAEAEVAFAVRALDPSPGARLLDLACGAGRHLRALESAGFDMVGLDLSRQLLTRARSHRESRLVRADMRGLPFPDASFDAVVSFFTSFGYFPTAEEDFSVLREVRRVLQSHGRYLIDFLHAPSVETGLVPRSESEREGYRILEERAIAGGRVTKTVSITEVATGASVLRYQESVRLYAPEELEDLVVRAGFGIRGVYGGLDGRPAGNGPRVVIVAEARP